VVGGMLVGYIRVSKSDGRQTLAPQRDTLLAAGVEPDRIYENLASGRHDDRPGLAACLKALQPGNTLVVWKLDRLGRNLKHLVTLIDTFTSRSIGLRSRGGCLTNVGFLQNLASLRRKLFLLRQRFSLKICEFK
jgi:DNA invertase Pin-like site-specific DNA recombinase